MSLFDLRSTTYFKAFILYAMAAAISASLAVEFRLSLQDKDTSLFKFIDPLTQAKGISDTYKIIATVIITFFTSILVYNFMHFVFGWGNGLLASKKPQGRSYF